MSSVFDASKTPKSRVDARVYRWIEGDDDIGIVKMADGVGNQNRLDELIDSTKPAIDKSSRHYLIKTPFRYPPLKYGSRFGTTLMPSYFYASNSTAGALAEAAYYHFLLNSDLKVPYS